MANLPPCSEELCDPERDLCGKIIGPDGKPCLCGAENGCGTRPTCGTNQVDESYVCEVFDNRAECENAFYISGKRAYSCVFENQKCAAPQNPKQCTVLKSIDTYAAERDQLSSVSHGCYITNRSGNTTTFSFPFYDSLEKYQRGGLCVPKPKQDCCDRYSEEFRLPQKKLDSMKRKLLFATNSNLTDKQAELQQNIEDQELLISNVDCNLQPGERMHDSCPLSCMLLPSTKASAYHRCVLRNRSKSLQKTPNNSIPASCEECSRRFDEQSCAAPTDEFGACAFGCRWLANTDADMGTYQNTRSSRFLYNRWNNFIQQKSMKADELENLFKPPLPECRFHMTRVSDYSFWEWVSIVLFVFILHVLTYGLAVSITA